MYKKSMLMVSTDYDFRLPHYAEHFISTQDVLFALARMQHTSEPAPTLTHIPNALCGYTGEYYSLPGGEPESTSKNQSQLNHHTWDHSLEINPMQCSI